jgi:predicted nucleotide-binding protein
MAKKRPLVFIGSSREGQQIASAIQAELQHVAECVIWWQGVFGLMEGTLEALVKVLDRYDFAILVLTPDDLVASRGDTQPAPRDNVLLELGLFIGGLGKERTFMVVDRSARLKLPTDLAGITPATFEPPQGGTFQSAVGPACTAVADSIRRLGPRNPISVQIK